MLVRWLPLIAALGPLIGVHTAYVLGVQADVLPTCIPYIDGCTSISATGRYTPGSLPFKATLFPQAAILAFLWWFAASWLRSLNKGRYARAIVVVGLIGALALIIYLMFLGTKAPFYEFMRRFGIYLYFLGTALAQLLFTLSLDEGRMKKTMLGVILFPWVIGIINLVQKVVISNPDNIENVIEWWASLAMQVWLILLYVLWRRDGIEVTLRAGSTNVPP